MADSKTKSGEAKYWDEGYNDKVEDLGKGKKTKFPVSSYYHIYGLGVILG